MPDTEAAAGPVAWPFTGDAAPSSDVWCRTAEGLTRTVWIDRSWWSWSGVHDGHVAALGLEAMGAALGDPGPVRAFSLTFLSHVDDRPLVLTPTVERSGLNTSVASLRGAHGSDAVLLAQATFGGVCPGPDYADVPIPDVPGPEGCRPLRVPDGLAPFAQHLEARPALRTRPFAGGDRAELMAWLRFADGRPVDEGGLVVLLDAPPPALYATLTTPVPVPTGQLSIDFTDALAGGPVTDWILVRMRTEHAGGGWATDVSSAWTQDGRLLGQARQTRRILGGACLNQNTANAALQFDADIGPVEG
jgi:acyl-CoA thioesterase